MDHVALELLQVVHPTPTRNVSDIGTKVLSVSRTGYLLGLMNFRSAADG